MVRAARVVEHLRLRGESESAVRHALPALEDAFRTASLPDAGARLICVRRLQLGQLAANASAQSVSLLIEKRFAEDDWTIVHAVEGGADDAQAVWFRDAFEAHEAAALKIAAGQPLDDWFWPLAIPAITAAASDERLRAIAFAVAVDGGSAGRVACLDGVARSRRIPFAVDCSAAARRRPRADAFGRRQRRLDGRAASEHALTTPRSGPSRHEPRPPNRNGYRTVASGTRHWTIALSSSS